MDFKQLSNKAKELVEKRGGSDRSRRTPRSSRRSRRARAAPPTRRRPPCPRSRSRARTSPTRRPPRRRPSPSAQGPRRRSRARQGASTSMRASAAAAADAGAAAEAVAARPDRAAAELIDWRVMHGDLKQSTQQLLHLLSRGRPGQRLAGATVQLGRDLVELGLAVRGEVGALGQVLAQEAVGVLVRAPLPGRVGSQK